MQNDGYKIKTNLHKDGKRIHTELSKDYSTFNLLGFIVNVIDNSNKPLLETLGTLKHLTSELYGIVDEYGPFSNGRDSLIRIQGTGALYYYSKNKTPIRYLPQRLLTVGESLVALAEPAKELLKEHDYNIFEIIQKLLSSYERDLAVSVCGIATGVYDARKQVAWKKDNIPESIYELLETVPFVSREEMTGRTKIKGGPNSPIIEGTIEQFGSSSDYPYVGIGMSELISFYTRRFGPFTLDQIGGELKKINFLKEDEEFDGWKLTRKFSNLVLKNDKFTSDLEELKSYALDLFNLHVNKAFFYDYFLGAFEKRTRQLVSSGHDLFEAYRLAAQELDLKSYPENMWRFVDVVIEDVHAKLSPDVIFEDYILEKLGDGVNIINILENLKNELPISPNERSEAEIIDIGISTCKSGEAEADLYYYAIISDLPEQNKKHFVYRWEEHSKKRAIEVPRISEEKAKNIIEFLKSLRSKYPEKLPFDPRIEMFVS